MTSNEHERAEYRDRQAKLRDDAAMRDTAPSETAAKLSATDAAAMEAISETAAKLSATFAEMAEDLQRAVTAFAEKWPPERIVASAIMEHNRRVDEFNRRPDAG